MEEEVAADEVDEVVHKGPDKKGRVLWVVSHKSIYRQKNSKQYDGLIFIIKDVWHHNNLTI